MGTPRRDESRAVVAAQWTGRRSNVNLLAATYGKFTEGFGTSDLILARGLLAEFGSFRRLPEE